MPSGLKQSIRTCLGGKTSSLIFRMELVVEFTVQALRHSASKLLAWNACLDARNMLVQLLLSDFRGLGLGRTEASCVHCDCTRTHRNRQTFVCALPLGLACCVRTCRRGSPILCCACSMK